MLDCNEKVFLPVRGKLEQVAGGALRWPKMQCQTVVPEEKSSTDLHQGPGLEPWHVAQGVQCPAIFLPFTFRTGQITVLLYPFQGILWLIPWYYMKRTLIYHKELCTVSVKPLSLSSGHCWMSTGNVVLEPDRFCFVVDCSLCVAFDLYADFIAPINQANSGKSMGFLSCHCPLFAIRPESSKLI